MKNSLYRKNSISALIGNFSGKFLPFILSIIIVSCTSVKEEPIGSGYSVVFIPGTCEYVYTNIVRSGKEKVGESEVVKISSFLMDVKVTDSDSDVPRFNSGYNKEASDKVIEEQILTYFIQKYKRSPGGSNMYFIEYRKEVCEKIEITASVPLFGKEAGEDISDNFVFANNEHIFWFQKDKRLLGVVEDGLAIKEYLSVKPLMLPDLLFRFSRKPQEIKALQECELTVRISLEGGKILEGKTAVILENE